MCRHVPPVCCVLVGCVCPRTGLIGVKQSSVKKPSEMLCEKGSLLLGDFLPTSLPLSPPASLPLKISHRPFTPICCLPLPLTLSWLQTLAVYQSSTSLRHSASPSAVPGRPCFLSLRYGLEWAREFVSWGIPVTAEEQRDSRPNDESTSWQLQCAQTYNGKRLHTQTRGPLFLILHVTLLLLFCLLWKMNVLNKGSVKVCIYVHSFWIRRVLKGKRSWKECGNMAKKQLCTFEGSRRSKESVTLQSEDTHWLFVSSSHLLLLLNSDT